MLKTVGKRDGIVAVVGAGQCGRMTAQRLAELDVFERIVLTDAVEGLAAGIALDINQSRAVAGHETTVHGHVVGPEGHRADVLAGAEIVVVTAGVAPGARLSPQRVLAENSVVVRDVGEAIRRYAPDAVVVVVTNPVDTMTALARAVTGFPPHRVLGQSVLLDTARFIDFTAERLGVPRSAIHAVTLGSHLHDDTMIPLLSNATVHGVPLTSLLSKEDLAAVVAATRRGGADVLRLLGSGSSFHAPSAATARLVRAIREDATMAFPVCACLTGEYGLRDVALGVPAVLDRGGVSRVVELPLSLGERRALDAAAATLRREQQHCLSMKSVSPD